MCFFAATPEAFAAPVASAQSTIAAMTKPVAIDPPALTGMAEISGDGTNGHPDCVNFARGLRFMCDVPTTSARNPYACDANGNASTSGDHDCYDSMHMGVLRFGQLDAATNTVVNLRNRVVGTRVTVVVAQPKTGTATVTNVAVWSILSELDPRRQPMQPRQRQSGVIAAGMFCANEPSSTMTAGGILTDRWMAGCP